MPIITIKTPNDPSQRFEVSPNRETVTLGRSSKSDIKISCESVSGNHATIRKLKEGYVLRDLGSTNGTKLDGKKVSEIHLDGSQNILLGDVTFTFQPDPGSDKPKDNSKEELPPLKEEAKSKRESRSASKPDASAEAEPQTEKDPVIWGLSLMGSGLIAVGFIVLIGMDAIRAIPDRGENFIIGGIALIVAGLLCLGSILFVTGRIKFPKLVVQFDDEDDDDEDEEEPRRKRKKEKKKRKEPKDEDDSEDDSDEDDDDDNSDDGEELGKAPKGEDEDKSSKED